MIDLKGREETIRRAKEHLKIASTLIYTSASGVTPFRMSKLLNVIGKTTYDDWCVLSIVLGDMKPEDFVPTFKTHGVKLLQTQIEEDPSIFKRGETTEK